MHSVKLFTKDGRLVTDVTIPPFQTWPDVLVWGDRFFTYRDSLDPDGLGAYQEAFGFVVVPEIRTAARPDGSPKFDSGGAYDGDAD